MPIDQDQLARRLRAAREAAGVTQEQAAAAVGISRPGITQIEAGKRSVSGLELSTLAVLYREDLRVLLDAAPTDGTGVAAHFRLDPDLVDDPEVIDALVKCQRLGRELHVLEGLAGIERPAIVAYDVGAPASIRSAMMQGAQVADAERRRLGLGDAPLEDLTDLLEANGVRTAALDMPNGISGLMLDEAGAGPLVVANRGHYVHRRTFSLAHEYAHVLLDRTVRGSVTRSDGGKDLREIRANMFAGAFLMPEGGVRRHLAEIGKGGTDRPSMDAGAEVRSSDGSAGDDAIRVQDLVVLAHAFKVTRPAMANRLRSLRIVTQRRFEEICEDEARSGRVIARLLGLAEPDHAAERRRLGTRIARLAFEAFERGNLTKDALLGHLVRDVGLDAAEARAAVEEAIGARS